jgi:hypothetical protein
LLLGPRIGKFVDGKPHANPGHKRGLHDAGMRVGEERMSPASKDCNQRLPTVNLSVFRRHPRGASALGFRLQIRMIPRCDKSVGIPQAVDTTASPCQRRCKAPGLSGCCRPALDPLIQSTASVPARNRADLRNIDLPLPSRCEVAGYF